MNWTLLIWIAVLVMMILVIILQRRYIVLSKRQQKEIESKLASLMEEKSALDEVLHQPNGEQYESLIRHRTDLLARMLAAGVSGDSSRSDAVLEEINKLVSDREEFLRQTRIVYENWQPEMMARLKECNLTDEEIEICCLYALGLNGKSIQQYTRDGRHYQNVGLIRKKLGLGEHDKNIDGYIKSLIK
jgi:hypothetical protein